jgi:hypothetical protein
MQERAGYNQRARGDADQRRSHSPLRRVAGLVEVRTVKTPSTRKASPRPPPRGWRRQAHVDWLDLHADVRVPPNDRARLEHLCRYLLRPPLAEDRLRLRADGAGGDHAEAGLARWNDPSRPRAPRAPREAGGPDAPPRGQPASLPRPPGATMPRVSLRIVARQPTCRPARVNVPSRVPDTPHAGRSAGLRGYELSSCSFRACMSPTTSRRRW